jgi:predicted MFS family arabinose efflux permease
VPAGTPLTRRGLLPLVLAGLVSQALIVVLAPTVVAVADDLDTTVSAVSQARVLTAVAAIATAPLAGLLLRGNDPGRPVAAGAVCAVAGMGAAAAAPSLGAYLAAHVLAGAAVGMLLTAAFAGVAAFVPGDRARALGVVVAANAAAWIVVNPITGTLTEAISWRAGQLVPAVLAVAPLVLARVAVPIRGEEVEGNALRALLRDVGARRWVVAECAAYTGWAAELTFVGAFFIERHDLGEGATGLLLAVGAAVFMAASMQFRRVAARLPRRHVLTVSSLAMGALIALQLNVAPSVAFTLAAFCAVAVAAGVRSPASASLGLGHCAQRPGAMMAARSAATQAGYLAGAAVGAAVLTAHGYDDLGWALAAIMVAAAALMARVPEPGAL